MTVEYKVNNVRVLRRFLDKEIGTEYEVDANKFDFGGYVTVLDLTNSERKKINTFIKENKLK